MKKQTKTVSYYPEIKETFRIYANNSKNDPNLPVFAMDIDYPTGELRELGFPTLNRMFQKRHFQKKQSPEEGLVKTFFFLAPDSILFFPAPTDFSFPLLI
jgi:hypothetical protein